MFDLEKDETYVYHIVESVDLIGKKIKEYENAIIHLRGGNMTEVEKDEREPVKQLYQTLKTLNESLNELMNRRVEFK